MHFAVFVTSSISKDILNGSTDEFRAKMDRFAHELKRHMGAHSTPIPKIHASLTNVTVLEQVLDVAAFLRN